VTFPPLTQPITAGIQFGPRRVASLSYSSLLSYIKRWHTCLKPVTHSCHCCASSLSTTSITHVSELMPHTCPHSYWFYQTGHTHLSRGNV